MTRRLGVALAALVLVGMQAVPGPAPLARVIAGETPGCSFEAKIAAAWVYENRLAAGIEGGWFGDAEPTLDDWLAATWWQAFEDPTDGALFFIGPGDGARMPWLAERTGRWVCPETWVEAWK